MSRVWSILLFLFTAIACGGYEYVPPPMNFDESDLVGTWQATYGLTSTDTITLKSDGTYQQKFEAPQINYVYESPWYEWRVEYSASRKPKLHLEKMRYYEFSLDIGEAGGRHSDGQPVLFVDIDEDDEVIEMMDKVILRINGDQNYPRGIILQHMHIDLDTEPAYFVLVDD